ncbi:hypothetical protein LINPERHAP1_LOCUS15763, partial [Linum perenne]
SFAGYFRSIQGASFEIIFFVRKLGIIYRDSNIVPVQKKSSTNKQNRRKHDDDEIPTVRHHNGSKPTRQIIYDMIEENGGEEPDLLAIFNRIYGQDGEVKDPGALAKRVRYSISSHTM